MLLKRKHRMTSETLIIVADKFADFAQSKKAVTLSHVRAMLALPEHIIPGPVRLLAGQGLSDAEHEALIQEIDIQDPNGIRWDVSELRSIPVRAHGGLSHKRHGCNTLIGIPVQVSEDTYVMDIRIDGDCEIMGDHQTGQHVQGMVLVEAARQAFLAVTEEFFLEAEDRETYFVINSMTTEFSGFVFPLPAQIAYRVLTADINERRRKFNVEMDVVQGGQVRTRIACSFAVFPHDVLAEKEAALAQEAMDAILSAHPESAVAHVA